MTISIVFFILSACYLATNWQGRDEKEKRARRLGFYFLVAALLLLATPFALHLLKQYLGA